MTKNNTTDFRRHLSPGKAILIMTGNMVGVGIFIYPSLIASNLPHAGYFVGIWIVGGLIAISGALSSAELATLYPEAGGDYTYLKNGIGKRWAFLYGFLTFFITFPGSAALGVSLTVYYQGTTLLGSWIRDIVFSYPLIGVDIHYYHLIAVGILALLILVNHLGVGASLFLQKVATVAPLALLVVISFVILGSAASEVHGETHAFRKNFSAIFATGQGMPDLFKLGAAIVPVYWTFMGWNSPLTMGGEIENPRRVIPRIMILGPLLVTVIYILFALTFITVINYSELQSGNNDPFFILGTYLMNIFTGDQVANSGFLSKALSVIILFIVLGNINSTMITGTRIAVAISRDGLFWERIGVLSGKHNTPDFCMRIQGIFAILLILAIRKDSDLLNFSFIAITLLSVLTIYSLFIIRKKHRGHFQEFEEIFYKTLFFPITPLIYMFSSALIVVLVLYNYFQAHRYEAIFWNAGIITAGLVFYEIWKAKKSRKVELTKLDVTH